MNIKFSFSVSAIVVLIIFCSIDVKAQRRRQSTRTTTTAVPVSVSDLEASLVDRELNLEKREENFRSREAQFREREDNLALREEKFKEREDKLSEREANISAREKSNAVKDKDKDSKCKDKKEDPETTIDLSEVRFDDATQKFQDIGSTEVCSQNMRFFALPESERDGDCDCDYHQCSRPLIYSEKYAQCFWAWTQGPCEQGEWYTFNATTLNPECKKNHCPESPGVGISKYYFENPEDGECYQTTTKGYCKNKGERLFVAPGEPIPQCRKQTICSPISIPALHECYPGNKRYQADLC